MSNVIKLEIPDRLKLNECMQEDIEVALISYKGKYEAVYLQQGEDTVMFKPDEIDEIIQELKLCKEELARVDKRP